MQIYQINAKLRIFVRMGRILAIDYGTKRCGIAVTDPTQTIATALETVASHQALEFLKKYLQAEKVERIVIGRPRKLDNSEAELSGQIAGFVSRLSKQFPGLEIVSYDERFTSLLASRSLIESGQSKKTRQDKSVLDRVSATILLQDYLNSIQNKP